MPILPRGGAAKAEAAPFCPVKQALATSLLRAAGWRCEGTQPKSKKCVVVAAPHTSNWDLPLMLLYSWAYDLSPHFMMKHTVFVGPLEGFGFQGDVFA